MELMHFAFVDTLITVCVTLFKISLLKSCMHAAYTSIADVSLTMDGRNCSSK